MTPSEEKPYIARLVTAWRNQYNAERKTAAKVLEEAQPDLRHQIERALSDRDVSTRTLGRLLARHEGEPHMGYVIEAAGSISGLRRWAVRHANREQPEESLPPLRALLQAWHAAIGERPVTSKGAIVAADDNLALHDALAAVAVPQDRLNFSAYTLGRYLGRNCNAEDSGLRLEMSVPYHNATTWRVVRLE